MFPASKYVMRFRVLDPIGGMATPLAERHLLVCTGASPKLQILKHLAFFWYLKALPLIAFPPYVLHRGNFFPTFGFYRVGDVSEIYSYRLAGVPQAEDRGQP